MSVTGNVDVTCPACGRTTAVRLVQSINAERDANDHRRLLAGELNVLACECGKRTQLAANVVFHDPRKDVYVRVVPGGDEAAMVAAAAQFRAAGATGTQRLVPSLNALVEKVKIFEADLADWAVEITKVLLLATVGDLDRVLLFDRAEAETLHWVLFAGDGGAPQTVASPRAAYERIAARAASRPATTEVRIDRAWAVEAARQLVAAQN